LSRELPPPVQQTYGEREAYEHHKGVSAAQLAVLPIPQGFLNIVQRPIAPLVIAGASKEQVDNYLRRKATLIPAVAAALREGFDPLDFIVLLRSDVQQIRPMEIQGVKGYAIKDSRGFGSVLMWEKRGVMHTVEGTYSTDELLRVASSLHV
jgi:hypothetical protein